MNLNNFTIKSQEAIQQAQQIAQSFGHQQVENEHLFKGIFEVDENVLPFLLKKLNVKKSISSKVITTSGWIISLTSIPILVIMHFLKRAELKKEDTNTRNTTYQSK